VGSPPAGNLALVTSVSSNTIVVLKTMAFAKISSWPRRAILHTTSKRETPGGSSGQDLCQRCNNVIRNFERAFTLPDGWGAQDKEVMFRLQEAALGLKQWKNSIRWCATPDHECFSEADNEKLVQLVLASLRKENSGLFETISANISAMLQNCWSLSSNFTSMEMTKRPGTITFDTACPSLTPVQ
jgi:hypothetical protein